MKVDLDLASATRNWNKDEYDNKWTVRSKDGDVLFVLDPTTITYSLTGSTHGSGYSYDTHVPLIFYGFGINKGETLERTEITDVAPTISSLLNISFPNGAIGTPIEKAIN